MTKVIISIWSDGRVECYSTLTVFLEHNPGRNYETISYHISRNSRPYFDGEVTIHRCTVTRATGGLNLRTLNLINMTEQKELKTNEAGAILIAKFMGEDKLTRVKNGKIVPYVPSYKIWGTLMPVIEKIESNPINDVCIFKEATQIRVWSGEEETFIWKVLEPDANSKIDHAFRAVVKYIEWYFETQERGS